MYVVLYADMEISINNIPLDVLKIIASYIIPPYFSSKDYNSFIRICKLTSRLSTKKLRDKKADEFNIDLFNWEKLKLMKETKQMLESSVNKKVNKKVVKVLKTFRSRRLKKKINDVLSGRKNQSYVRINIKDTNVTKNNRDILSKELVSTIKHVIAKNSKFINNQQIQIQIRGNFITERTIKNNRDLFFYRFGWDSLNDQSKYCILIYFSTDKDYLHIYIYNVLEFRKEVLGKLSDRKRLVIYTHIAVKEMCYDNFIDNNLNQYVKYIIK